MLVLHDGRKLVVTTPEREREAGETKFHGPGRSVLRCRVLQNVFFVSHRFLMQHVFKCRIGFLLTFLVSSGET